MGAIIFVKVLNVFLIFVFIFLQYSTSLRIDSVISEQSDAFHDAYLDSNVALKRRQTAGLIPFPRVGRNGNKYWSSQFLGQTKRREGLIPFPRVGKRTDEKLPVDIGISASWFGPRLGRGLRRPVLGLEDQFIISLIRDYQQLEETKKEDGKSPNADEYIKRRSNLVEYPTNK